jgi:hypothetical protein
VSKDLGADCVAEKDFIRDFLFDFPIPTRSISPLPHHPSTIQTHIHQGFFDMLSN